MHSDSAESVGVVRNKDCFITTREAESILGFDYAWKNWALILSGLDAVF